MIPKLTATLIFSALILCACYKNTVGPQPQPDPFPNTAGSWWRYEVFDSLTMTTDTALVTVLDSTAIQNGDSFTVWSVVFSNRSVPSFTRTANDTITVTLSVSQFDRARNEQFVLPLTLGNKWHGVLEQHDSSEVTSVGDLATRAGTFSSVAEISRGWVLGFEGGGGRNLTFIAPGVGIVRQVELFIVSTGGAPPFTAVHAHWELLEYGIAT